MTIRERLFIAAASVVWLAPTAFAQDHKPLFTLYNEARGDSFTTTDERWKAARAGDRVGYPAYQFNRVEGQVFSQNHSGFWRTVERSYRLVPLVHWYHPGHEDNMATTDPRWQTAPAEPGYINKTILGYMFDPTDSQPPGTIPLFLYWNAGQKDYMLTTDTRFYSLDYIFKRREGYIYPPRYEFTDLFSLYGDVQTDNFATTDSSLAPGGGRTAGTPPYRFYRCEGRVIANPLRVDGVIVSSPPPGTVPLVQWYSALRLDYFTTTDPRWVSTPGEASYAYQRTVGYVYDRALPQPAGTIRLFSLWDPNAQDNFLTTDLRYWGSPGQIVAGPSLVFVRLEGYIYPCEEFI